MISRLSAGEVVCGRDQVVGHVRAACVTAADEVELGVRPGLGQLPRAVATRAGRAFEAVDRRRT
jgi:hypothetical protein